MTGVRNRGRWHDTAGFLVVLACALVLAWLVIEGRGHLALGGDLHTLRTNNEDYHWGIVRYPQRVDPDIFWMVLVGSIMYPTVALSHAGHYLVQALFPTTRTFQAFCNISVVETLLFLTPFYFVARHRRVPVSGAVLASVALMANPFLLRQLLSAPVLPTAALLPLIYLAYLKGWWRTLFVLVIFGGCSYRAGGIFVALFLLAVRDVDARSSRFARRMALMAAVTVGVIQFSAQWLLLLTPYVQRIEGELIGLLPEKTAAFLASPLAPDSLARVGELAAWFLAAGGLLAVRGMNRWRALLLLVLVAYVFLVTGTLSESQMYFIPMVALLALEGARGPIAFLTRRGWPTSQVLAIVRIGVVAGVTLGLPAIHRDIPTGVEAVDRPETGLVVPGAYYALVARFPPSPHVEAVQDALGRLPPTSTCCVDPFLMTYLSGEVCRWVIPVGKMEAGEALARCERVVLDASAAAQRFRTDLDAYAGYQEPWRASFEAMRAALQGDSQFGSIPSGVPGLEVYESITHAGGEGEDIRFRSASPRPSP